MRVFWIDLETTGRDPRAELILEVAIAEAEFERPFDLGPMSSWVSCFDGAHVREEDDHPFGMAPEVVEMHTRNGLLAESKVSPLHVWDVENALLARVPAGLAREEMPVLAGSSVHFDAAFLASWMPTLAERFSHRHYDVSAVKLFCQSLGMEKFKKAEAHRAADDIRESVAHAKACRDWLLGQR